MTSNRVVQEDAETTEQSLIEQAKLGNRLALGKLLRTHQTFIYNLAFYMLQNQEDANDVTQEVLSKVVDALPGFRGDSKFRTWVKQISVRTVLDFRRSRPEQVVTGFDCYADYLSSAQDEAWGNIEQTQERQLLIEEARLSCTLGMLLCLDRDLRIAFLLGEILEISDTVAAEVLGIARDNFRQRLTRARSRLSSFMQGHCGLVEPTNPCRCAKKAGAFARDQIISLDRLMFVKGQLTDAHDVLGDRRASADTEEAATLGHARQLYPIFEPPLLVSRLRTLLSCGELSDCLGLSEAHVNQQTP